jgi:hypothetical protein
MKASMITPEENVHITIILILLWVWLKWESPGLAGIRP